MAWVHKCLVSVDQALGVIFFNGHPGETISSWIGRNALKGKRWALAAAWVLNKISRGHTTKAIAGDLHRAEVVETIEEKVTIKTISRE